MSAPAGLAGRIQTELHNASSASGWSRRLRVYAAPLAAAAMLVLAVGLSLFVGGKSAQADFYRIHQETLQQAVRFEPGGPPAELQQALQKQLGRAVAAPELHGNCVYLGSRVETFRKRAVAGLLVKVGHREVTVLQIPDEAASLGFSHSFRHNGKTWHNCQYEDCRLLAVSAGGQTFVAVGEIGKDELMGLLEQFVSAIEG